MARSARESPRLELRSAPQQSHGRDSRTSGKIFLPRTSIQAWVLQPPWDLITCTLEHSRPHGRQLETTQRYVVIRASMATMGSRRWQVDNHKVLITSRSHFAISRHLKRGEEDQRTNATHDQTEEPPYGKDHSTCAQTRVAWTHWSSRPVKAQQANQKPKRPLHTCPNGWGPSAKQAR